MEPNLNSLRLAVADAEVVACEARLAVVRGAGTAEQNNLAAAELNLAKAKRELLLAEIVEQLKNPLPVLTPAAQPADPKADATPAT